ncbi:MAG: ABC transporter permease [Lachnospiraceae bacterium]|nr:ABC transporter permease [Lachnospiraceae bacterium]
MSAKTEIVITPKRKLLDLRLGEVWHYRSLVRMLVRRDFVTYYKQTILGPLWYLFSPICSTLMYMIVFGNLANMGTDSIPQPLFYFSGTILWGFFSGTLMTTGRVFEDNKGLFGKVYFPRVIVPISNTIVAMIKLGIQLALFLLVFIYYLIVGEVSVPGIQLLLFPLTVLWIITISLGIGMVISSITSKYKDIAMALSFLMSLFMYSAPVVYPISELSGKLRLLICLNPVSAPIELFRYSIFGVSEIPLWSVIYSLVFAVLILFFGLVIFNRNEQKFIDVI